MSKESGFPNNLDIRMDLISKNRCLECNKFEPNFSNYNVDCFVGGSYTMYFLSCLHEDACDHTENFKEVQE